MFQQQQMHLISRFKLSSMDRTTVVLLLVFSQSSLAKPIIAYGVNQIPLLDQNLPSWIHAEHRPYFGPLGAYFNTLLQGCGVDEGFAFKNWTSSGRMAEYDILTTDAEVAFPVARLWRTSSTTLSREAGGAYFLPVIESPGMYLNSSST